MPLKINEIGAALGMHKASQRRCWAEDPFKEGILGWARSASPSFFLVTQILSQTV